LQAMRIPLIVTEQYPKALGHTVRELQVLFDTGELCVAASHFKGVGHVDVVTF
jgi:hypothetical protein